VGLEDCKAAVLLHGGPKACFYGCVGLGNCARVCPVNAIVMEEGFPRVIPQRCIGCGACVKECPKGLFVLRPQSKQVHVLCSSQAKGAQVKKVCAVGCIGCKKCEKVCPVDAAKVENFLASIDPEKCINCGKCVEECPTNAIRDFRKPPRLEDQPARSTAAATA